MKTSSMLQHKINISVMQKVLRNYYLWGFNSEVKEVSIHE